MDNEDPVIHEMNVVISKQIMNVLYLLQYPIHPNFVTLDSSKISEVKVKFQSQKLQINLQLQNKPEKRNGWVEENCEDENNHALILNSKNTNVNKNCFALGCVYDHNFYFCPLSSILQMRPKIIDQKKDESIEKEDEISGPETFVTAVMKHKETDIAKNKRLASYEHFQNSQENDLWVPLQTHNITEHELYSTFNDKLKTNPVSEFYMSSSEYINILTDTEKKKGLSKAEKYGKAEIMDRIKSLRLGEQIKLLLEWSKVINFNQITSILPDSSDLDDILKHLQQYAVLVQGNWVIKSDLLFTNNPSCLQLRSLRDYILYQYAHNYGVTREELNKLFKISEQEEKILFYDISEKCMHSKKWIFCMKADKGFVVKFSEIAERQLLLLSKRFQQIKNTFALPK